MIVQVYNALKEDHRKGDFVHLTDIDRQYLEIELSDEDIQNIPKMTWKKYFTHSEEILVAVDTH